MIERYDPLKPPSAAEWLGTKESERLVLVENHHRRARVRVPNLKAHAAFHVAVENQAALGEETPVRRTLERLMAEGIDRHEALHAVAAVLSENIYNLGRQSAPVSDLTASYYAALDSLTVESWRKNFG